MTTDRLFVSALAGVYLLAIYVGWETLDWPLIVLFAAGALVSAYVAATQK